VAASIADLISLHLDEAPLPIELASPDARASDDIERVIMRALAKLPRFRHASPEDFSRDLEEAVDHSRKTSVLQNMNFPPDAVVSPLVAATDGLPRVEMLTAKNPGEAGEIDAKAAFILSTVSTGESESFTTKQETRSQSTAKQPAAEQTTPDRVAGEQATSPARDEDNFFLLETQEPPPSPIVAAADQSAVTAASRIEEVVFTLNDEQKPVARPLFLDRNAQFTVWQPACVQPLVWVPMLVVAQVLESADERAASEAA